MSPYKQTYTGFNVSSVVRNMQPNGKGTVRAGYLEISAMKPDEVDATGRLSGKFQHYLLQKIRVPVIKTNSGLFVDTKYASRLGLPQFEQDTLFTLLQNANQGIKDGDIQSQYFIPNKFSESSSGPGARHSNHKPERASMGRPEHSWHG